MSIKVKGFLKDVGGASRVTKLRAENFAKGSTVPDPKDPIRELDAEKAAESLKRIEARNIIPFRVGGDEFIVIAIHVSREEAERIGQRWRDGLAELNRAADNLPCVIACGFAFGEKEDDLEDVLKLADKRMYEKKQQMKELQRKQ